ncbi:hypothetical protein [Clostridium sp. AM58-1XD]|uniref:hypothetical protein n=1 Tax=Clostridium sp. AM58-1XD TaxID=2292307 RepID=UPI000E471C99|nr:hypothetical protein [Clostridium sp. AM58-1XD]RGZ00886.1 hypothetical protein DXA13_03065 [Clostridium sp. AM58-1XD]
MRKRGYGIIISAAFMSGLTACGSGGANPAEPVSKTDTQVETAETAGKEQADEADETDKAASEAVVSKETNGVERTMKSAGYDRRSERAAFIYALNQLYSNHKLPDGSDCGFDGYGDISENKFAVYDVDSDGRDELIIQYTTTYMAGMAAGIYGYDEASNTIREELLEFPALTFYNNGVIEAGWSHNQGLAGDFWPYTLYRYNQNTDTYTSVGMVDAWDRSYWESDYDGNPFPNAIDRDGDGIIYYVMTGGEYEVNTPVDSKEYNQWRNSYVGGAEEIYIPFIDLTRENINSLN